jgi:hypothetical protein
MMQPNSRMALCVVLTSLVLGGCAAPPLGPTVAVMPAPGMPFDHFQRIDANCRSFAATRVGGTAQAANQSAVTSALAGAAVGAAAGALIGGNQNAAGVGAGVGLLAGSSAGSSQYALSGYAAQRAYDIAYSQCMYASGAVLPGYPTPAYTPPPPPPHAP